MNYSSTLGEDIQITVESGASIVEEYLRARRDALLMELRAIEKLLSLEPTLTASQVRRASQEKRPA